MVAAFLLLLPVLPLAALRGVSTQGPSLLAAAPRESGPLLPVPCCPSGAPACPDTGGPPSPLSPRAVREAARGWEWKPLETPGWKILLSRNFVVRGDVPVDSLRTTAAYLEEFLKMVQGSVGGDATGLMFSARVYAEARDFRRYAARLGAPNAESLYDPRSAEVVVCLGHSTGPSWLQRTLAHEFTHAYMDRVWRRTDPLWFAEGMAEYFSNFSVKAGRLVPGAADPDSLTLLRLGDPVPLADLVRSGRDEMYGPTFRMRYAQAWSLVHYLQSKGDGTIDLLLRGGKLEKPEELEEGWKGHLKTLK